MTRRGEVAGDDAGQAGAESRGRIASASGLHDVQEAFAAHLRDPARNPPPPGIEPRRLQVYRDLFFANIERVLAGTFPVIRRIQGERWPALVRGFYAGHGSHTPLFAEIPREFLRWLQDTGGREPWLPELAHYEWVELALQLSTARLEDTPHDPLDAPGDEPGPALLGGCPLLSPLAWPLAYAWPVHRIGPDFQPASAPSQPTLLLLHRDASGKVRFHAPSPLAWRLLQRLEEEPACTGRAHLEALAHEAGTLADDAFLAAGAEMLRAWHRDGIVPGVRR